MSLTYTRPIEPGTRIGTMLTDHFVMVIIAMIFTLPGMVTSITQNLDSDNANTEIAIGQISYLSLFGLSLYFCKDVFNGRSIAKRIFKLQVVDKNTGRAASPLQTLVRNMFCILWMIEVFVAWSNTSQRLGDKVAGTMLVPFDAGIEQPKINIVQVIIALVLSFSLMLLLLKLLPGQ
jgi:uncharacterized RDD family membrane protein YckC